jgi:type I restriction enzyme S subunit
MTQSDLNNHQTALPPLPEQTAIANFLDDNTARIDTAITIKQNQIEKLNEYKTTLINAAVTGKIKVV